MEEKHRFISLALSSRFAFAELCLDFKVSRKTGYKWLRRYRDEGRSGLQPRSHRTQHCPHQTAAKIERLVLQERAGTRRGDRVN